MNNKENNLDPLKDATEHEEAPKPLFDISDEPNPQESEDIEESDSQGTEEPDFSEPGDSDESDLAAVSGQQSTAPTVTWVGTSGTKTGAFTVTLGWNPAVSGFNRNDVIVTNGGTLTNFRHIGFSTFYSFYSFTITPRSNSSGTITIRIPANRVSPANCEQSTTVSYDTRLPTIDWTNVPSTVQDSAFTVRGSWSKDVSNFNSSDITLSTGTISNFSFTNNRNFSFTVTPPTPSTTSSTPPTGGTITITVSTNSVCPGNCEATTSVNYKPPRPTITWTTLPRAAQDSQFQVAGRWSYAVDHFSSYDVSANNGATVSNFSKNSDNRNFSFYVTPPTPSSSSSTPPTGGTITITVRARAVQTNTPYRVVNCVQTASVPYKPPRPTITWTTLPRAAQDSQFQVAGRWSYAVDHFSSYDVSANNGATVSNFSKNSDNRNFSFYVTPPTPSSSSSTPPTGGTITITVRARAVQTNTPYRVVNCVQTASVPYKPPRPTITWTTLPRAAQDSQFQVAGRWSYAVDHFSSYDVSANNGATVSNFSKNSDNRNFSFYVTPPTPSSSSSTPPTGGTITITVRARAVQTNTPYRVVNCVQTASVPYKPPRPTITWTTLPRAAQDSQFQVAGRWSYAVNGLTSADISANNGATVSNFSKNSDNRNFSFYVTPPPVNSSSSTPPTGGTITITVRDNAVTSGTPNSVTSCVQTASVPYKPPRPTITWTTLPRAAQDSQFQVAGRWSYAVDHFSSYDVSANNGATVSNFSKNSDNRNFSFYVTPPTPSSSSSTPPTGGTITITVRDNAVTSGTPNSVTSCVQTASVPYKPPRPTITWTTLPRAAQDSQFQVAGRWSYAVNGLTSADISANNGATVSNFSKNSDNRNFSFYVTPPPVNSSSSTPPTGGTITITVRDNAVTSGTPNSVTSCVQTASVPYKPPRPTITWTTLPRAAQDSQFQVAGRWSYAVNGLTSADISANNGATVSNFSKNSDNRNFSFYVTPPPVNSSSSTPPTGGTITITVRDNAVTSGTPNSVTSCVQTASVPYKPPRPTITWTTLPRAAQDSQFQVAGRWSYAVNGLTSADISANNGATVSNFSKNSDNRNFSFYVTPPPVNSSSSTPPTGGTITITVRDNAVTSGTPNSVTSCVQTASVPYKPPRPTITWTTLPRAAQDSQFQVAGRWSYAVNGLTSADISANNGATVSNFSKNSDNRNFSFYVTPPPVNSSSSTPPTGGTITITVRDNAVTSGTPNSVTSCVQTASVPYKPPRPTITWTTLPRAAQDSQFQVAGRWSYAVNGLTSADISANNGATVSNFSKNSDNRNFSFYVTPPPVNSSSSTPPTGGTITITVRDNAVTSGTPNSVTSCVQTASVPYKPPRPTITWTTLPRAAQDSQFQVAGRWSYAVNGLTSADISANNGATVSNFSKNSDNRNFSFYVTPPPVNSSSSTPPTGGTITITVRDNAVTSGTPNSVTSCVQTASVPYKPPRPTITWTTLPRAAQDSQFQVAGRWSYAVNGLTSADISANNGATVSNFSKNSDNRNFSFYVTPPPVNSSSSTPPTGGTITITVRDNAVTSGTPNSVTSCVQTASVPYKPPRPTITWTTLPRAAQDSQFQVAGRWSYAVNGLTSADISANNGATVSNFSKNSDNRNFSFYVTPPPVNSSSSTPPTGGTITITVRDNAVTSGTPNSVTSCVQTASVPYKPPRPTITWTGTTGLKTAVFTVTGRWSYAVNGLASDDLTVNSSASISNFSKDSNNRDFSFTVTPASNSSGTLTITVRAAAVSSGTPNSVTSCEQTESVTYDTRSNPRVLVSIGTATINRTNRTISWPITLSHSTLTGFDRNDIISRCPSEVAVSVTGSGTTRTVTFSGFSTDTDTGTASFSIRANAFDENSLPTNYQNNSQVSTSYSYDFSTTPPTITWTTLPTAAQDSRFQVVGRWSEAVSALTSNNITVDSGGSISDFSIVLDSDNRDFSFYVTPPPVNSSSSTPPTGGSITIGVRANAVRDVDENLPNAEQTASVPYKPPRPTITWTTLPRAAQDSQFQVAGRWSYAVNGLTSADISANNGATVSNFSKNSDNRNFSFYVTPPPVNSSSSTPPTGGTITITVRDNAVTSGTPNSVTSCVQTASVPYKPPRPTITWTTLPRAAQDSQFQVAGRWSYAVNGLTSADISANNGATVSNFSKNSDNRNFSFYVTPPPVNSSSSTPPTGGTITITVRDNAVTSGTPNSVTSCVQTASVPYKPPRPTITWTTLPRAAQDSQFQVAGRWSYAVNGLTSADISANNGATVSNFSKNSDNRNFSFYVTPPPVNSSSSTPPTGGTITITVRDNAVTSGTPNSVTSCVQTASVPYKPPRPTITWTTLPRAAQDSQFQVAGRWSYAVNGLTSADISANNGATVSNFSKNSDNRNFSFYVTPPPVNSSSSTPPTGGTITITVRDNAVTSGTPNSVTSCVQTASVPYKPPRPTITWTGTTGLKTAVFTVTGRWSYAVNGLASDDLTVNSSASISNFSKDSNNRDFSFTVTPASNSSGTLTITVRAAAVSSGTPNSVTSCEQTESVTYDTRSNPRVLVSIGTATINRTNRTISWPITLSHSTLTGFDRNDIISRCPSEVAVSVTGSGTTRTVTFSGFSTDTDTGTASFSIRANAFDENSLPTNYQNNSQVSTSYSYDFSTTPPTITWTTLPTAAQDSRFQVVGRWSEAVSALTSNNITVDSGGSISDFSIVLDSDNRDFSFYVTPPPVNSSSSTPPTGGSITIGVRANAVRDVDENLPNAEQTASVPYEPPRPTITWTGTTGLKTAVFTVTGRWSYAVNGLASDDLTVNSSASISNFSKDSNNRDFSFTVTPASNSSGTLTITVRAAAVSSGTPNSVDSCEQTESVTYDTRPNPRVRVTIGTGTVNETNRTISWPITLSHSTLMGLNSSDIISSVPSSAMVDVSISGASGTVTFSGFTAGTSGTAEFTIRADAFNTNSLPANRTNNAAVNAPRRTYTFPAVTPTTTPTTAPTVTWLEPLEGSIQKEAFTVKGQWSTEVLNFTESDIIVSTGNKSNFNLESNGQDFSFRVTPPFEAVTFRIPKGSVDTEQSGLVPTVTWLEPLEGSIQKEAFTVKGQWSTEVLNFTESDIIVSAGTKSDFQLESNNRNFSFTLNPPFKTIAIAIPKGEVMPTNTQEQSTYINYDTTLEYPYIESYNIPEGVQINSFNVDLKFSEPVAGISTDSFIFEGVDIGLPEIYYFTVDDSNTPFIEEIKDITSSDLQNKPLQPINILNKLENSREARYYRLIFPAPLEGSEGNLNISLRSETAYWGNITAPEFGDLPTQYLNADGMTSYSQTIPVSGNPTPEIAIKSVDHYRIVYRTTTTENPGSILILPEDLSNIFNFEEISLNEGWSFDYPSSLKTYLHIGLIKLDLRNSMLDERLTVTTVSVMGNDQPARQEHIKILYTTDSAAPKPTDPNDLSWDRTESSFTAPSPWTVGNPTNIIPNNISGDSPRNWSGNNLFISQICFAILGRGSGPNAPITYSEPFNFNYNYLEDLPKGLTLNNNKTINGTPEATLIADDNYSVIITANNGITPDDDLTLRFQISDS